MTQDKLGAWYLLGVIGIYIFFCNFCTPLYMDDYAYAFVWEHDFGNLVIGQDYTSFVRINSMGDIFLSMQAHYFNWGGRLLAHTLASFFIWQGKYLFNAANTLIFLMNILLIYWLATGEIRFEKLQTRYICMIFLLLWFCNPDFVGTNFWLIGSCNYAWMGAIQLFFILQYSQSNFRTETVKDKTLWKRPGMFLLGLMTGGTNENSGLVVIFLVMALVWRMKKEKRLEAWMIYGVFGGWLGWLLLISAPGNFMRNTLMLEMGADQELRPFFMHGIALGVDLFFLLPMLICLYYFKRRYRKWLGTIDVRRLEYIRLFALCGIANLLLMMLSPIYPVRAGFASIALICVSVVAAVQNFDEQVTLFFKNSIGNLIKAIFGCCVLLNLWGVAWGEIQIYQYHKNYLNPVLQANIGQDVLLDPLYIPDDILKLSLFHVGLQQVRRDRNYWYNRAVARYYGVKSITLQYP